MRKEVKSVHYSSIEDELYRCCHHLAGSVLRLLPPIDNLDRRKLSKPQSNSQKYMKNKIFSITMIPDIC